MRCERSCVAHISKHMDRTGPDRTVWQPLRNLPTNCTVNRSVSQPYDTFLWWQFIGQTYFLRSRSIILNIRATNNPPHTNTPNRNLINIRQNKKTSGTIEPAAPQPRRTETGNRSSTCASPLPGTGLRRNVRPSDRPTDRRQTEQSNHLLI